MKLITCRIDGAETICIVRGTRAAEVRALGLNYTAMNALIVSASEADLNMMRHAPDNAFTLDVSALEILAPIPHPLQDVLCLGLNYTEHREEAAAYSEEAFAVSANQKPIFFSKRVNEAPGDGAPIPRHADLTQKLDYECELAVILGRDALNVSPEDAEKYIFGYTICNDVSARDLQTTHKQWFFGKSLDGFTPLGPVIVTADEIAYPPKLGIRSYVNGELRQNSTTDMLIFSISRIISELSRGMTLKAGTIITTGTPKGVGMGFEPPKFLSSGDVVRCEIDGIGSLTNTVI